MPAGTSLTSSGAVEFQVFVLEHGRPDELAGLVREDQQPRMARLQAPDLEGVGVERSGARPRPVAGTEAVSLGADDGPARPGR